MQTQLLPKIRKHQVNVFGKGHVFRSCFKMFGTAVAKDVLDPVGSNLLSRYQLVMHKVVDTFNAFS